MPGSFAGTIASSVTSFAFFAATGGAASGRARNTKTGSVQLHPLRMASLLVLDGAIRRPVESARNGMPDARRASVEVQPAVELHGLAGHVGVAEDHHDRLGDLLDAPEP